MRTLKNYLIWGKDHSQLILLCVLFLSSFCGLASADVLNGDFSSASGIISQGDHSVEYSSASDWSIYHSGESPYGCYIESTSFAHSAPNFLVIYRSDLYNGHASQNVLLYDSNVLEFYYTLSSGNTLEVYIDGDLVEQYSTPTSQWYRAEIFLNYTGYHELEFSGTGMSEINIDDVSITSYGGEVYPWGDFFQYAEYLTEDNYNMFVVSMDVFVPGDHYYVDVYGLNSTAYTLLTTREVTGSDQFLCPSVYSYSGYDSVYAVLRTSDNVVIDTVDVPFFSSGDSMKFIPSRVNVGETSKLYYNYDYGYTSWLNGSFGLYDYCHYYSSGGYTITDTLKVSSMPKTSFGYYEINTESLALTAPLQVEYYLKHNDHPMLSARLTVGTNFTSPVPPTYEPIIPDINETNPDIPEPDVPDNYTLPDYPEPSNPSDPDNQNYNPSYNNTSYYDYTNHTWIYYNTTNYNNSTGYYPSDVAGNVSVDTSIYNGYYSIVDSALNPLANLLSGFTGFILSPVVSLTDSANVLNTQLSTMVSLADQSIIAEVVNPVFTGLPYKFQLMVLYSLILSVLGLFLTGGKS